MGVKWKDYFSIGFSRCGYTFVDVGQVEFVLIVFGVTDGSGFGVDRSVYFRFNLSADAGTIDLRRICFCSSLHRKPSNSVEHRFRALS